MITIVVQPTSGKLMAAYRPIVISATDSGNPPVVYCDVYIDGNYYKTISRTQAPYQFDVQDAIQEYIEKYIPSNGGSAIETDILHEVYVKIRSSQFDVNGFIQPDGPIPVQATGGTPSTPGGGTQSNSFWGVNATLQHEDNQDLETHLNSFKLRNWANTMAPLTHRPDGYRICKGDSDFFPVVNKGNSIDCLKINYKLKGQNTFQSINTCNPLPPINGLIWKWDRTAGDSVDLGLVEPISGLSPINGTFTSIDWGDGTIDTNLTHTYSTTGNFTVIVLDSTSTWFGFSDSGSPGPEIQHNLTQVVQWVNTLEHIYINPKTTTVTQITGLPNINSLLALKRIVNYSQQLTSVPSIANNSLLEEFNFGWPNPGISQTTLDTALNPLLRIIVAIWPALNGGSFTLNSTTEIFELNGSYDVASVNNFLQGLDAAGATSFSPPIRIIILTQTPPAPPTGLGLTSKNNLIAKNWTVLTD